MKHPKKRAAKKSPAAEQTPDLTGGSSENAVKVWELLRRNPAFREQVKSMGQRHEGTTSYKDLSKDFEGIDSQNPIAGFALRWLIKPGLVKLRYPRSPEDYGKEWTFEDWKESSYFCLDDRWLHELEGIITEEDIGKSYPYTYGLPAENPLTPETAWSETPKLFRFLFEWLWREYEFGPLPDLPENYFLVTGKFRKHQIDWRFLEDQTIRIDGATKHELERLRQLLAHHDIFAVPRILMQKKQMDSLKEQFDRFLQNLSEQQKLVVSFQKHPHFLGAPSDWEVFSSFYDDVKYLKGEGESQYQRTGLGVAIEKLIKNNQMSGKWSQTSNYSTLLDNQYSKMESLMGAVFPRFDFLKLLEVGMNVLPHEAVTKTVGLAASSCSDKLCTLLSV